MKDMSRDSVACEMKFISSALVDLLKKKKNVFAISDACNL